MNAKSQVERRRTYGEERRCETFRVAENPTGLGAKALVLNNPPSRNHLVTPSIKSSVCLQPDIAAPRHLTVSLPIENNIHKSMLCISKVQSSREI